MKKIIIKFGLIAGLIIGIWVIFLGAMHDSMDIKYGMLYGYTAMLISFSMIFVAVKNYRDTYQNGTVTFGQGFKIGLGISLIAATFYVGIWLIEYYFFFPDFFDKYSEAMVKQMQTEGATQAAIESTKAEMMHFKELCKNPLINAAVTYTEILPVGLLVSLVTALILKRKTNA